MLEYHKIRILQLLFREIQRFLQQVMLIICLNQIQRFQFNSWIYKFTITMNEKFQFFNNSKYCNDQN